MELTEAPITVPMTEAAIEIPEAVAILPDTTEKVEPFTRAQQAIFDREIKGAQGRAGREARERVTVLEKENAKLRQVAAGAAPDASEVAKLRAEIAAKELENAAIREQAIRQQKEVFITQQAQRQNFVDSDVVVQLTRDNLKWDESTKAFAVIGDDGQPRITATGEPLSTEAFFAEYANKRPYMVRSTVIGGHGSLPSNGPSAPREFALEQLFGVGSSSIEANKLALKDNRRFQMLRAAAKRKGLI